MTITPATKCRAIIEGERALLYLAILSGRRIALIDNIEATLHARRQDRDTRYACAAGGRAFCGVFHDYHRGFNFTTAGIEYYQYARRIMPAQELRSCSSLPSLFHFCAPRAPSLPSMSPSGRWHYADDSLGSRRSMSLRFILRYSRRKMLI